MPGFLTRWRRRRAVANSRVDDELRSHVARGLPFLRGLPKDDLPRLRGPEGQSAQVLAMYQAIAPQLDAIDLTVSELVLTGRGSWQAVLDSGATLELGRGTPAEVGARVQRFTHTLTQVTSKYGRRADALESADLRHGDGYALRLRGVTTVLTDGAKKPEQK